MAKLFSLRDICSLSFIRAHRSFSSDNPKSVRNRVCIVAKSTSRSFSSHGSDQERQINGSFPSNHEEELQINGISPSNHDESSCYKKRPFCKRCMKAMKVCICKRFCGIVPNRTKITILQNPKEKDHALGSSRIAMLGLDNIDLVAAPEADESIRIRQRCRSRQRKCELDSQQFSMLPEIEIVRLGKIISNVFNDSMYCKDPIDVLCEGKSHGMLCKITSNVFKDCMYCKDATDVSCEGKSHGMLCKITSNVFKDSMHCKDELCEGKSHGMLCKIVSEEISNGMLCNMVSNSCMQYGIKSMEGSGDDEMRRMYATYGSDREPSMCINGATLIDVDPSIHTNHKNMNRTTHIKYGTNVADGHGQSKSHVPTIEELKSLIPHGVSLLYPSEKAMGLSTDLVHEEDQSHRPLCHHLIVLDGTWSKAKRMYMENPWLHDLPHYKLLVSTPSLYGSVRKEPKPEYISTLESIVYALKILEPDIAEGLDGLLAVFDSMLEDQRHFVNVKQKKIQPKNM